MLASFCANNAGNPLSEPVKVDIKYPQLNYRGEVQPKEAYRALAEQGGVLVDVRTAQEWLAGTPDVAATKGKLATVSWKLAPNMQVNGDFLAQLDALNIPKNTPLFFICGSGGRSLDSAVTATTAGFTQCYNVIGGCEGERDADGSRKPDTGWKHTLPWKQG